MAIQTLKNIQPQFISIRPMNLYKKWTLTDLDFTTKSTLEDFIYTKWVSSSYLGNDIDDYYNNYYSGSIPSFPGLNIKYARYSSSDIGPNTDPNTAIVDDDGYILSYNYRLGDGSRFYPLYESQSGFLNPDGTYASIVHKSLQKLFYAPNATYHYLLYGTSSFLSSEAIVIEIPQRYVADTIEPGTFIFTDTSNIEELPYSHGSKPWQSIPGNNNILNNPLASEGIRLFDDKHGNLFDANYELTKQRGNIFYKMGIVVITDVKYARYFREHLIISGSII